MVLPLIDATIRRFTTDSSRYPHLPASVAFYLCCLHELEYTLELHKTTNERTKLKVSPMSIETVSLFDRKLDASRRVLG